MNAAFLDPRASGSSRYLADWYGQPASLIRSAMALNDQWPQILAAAEWLRQCSPLLITGIGSSYHAGLALEAFLARHGWIAKVVDASELVYHHPIPPSSGVIVASRSGQSIEIVKLMEKCRALQVPVAAVTNVPESPLTAYARSVIHLRTDFDHLVSLRMYTALVQGLLALGTAICDPHATFPAGLLVQVWQSVAERLDEWHTLIRESGFFRHGAVYYALARGGSWASANEARLLLEECGKTGATALTTGAFRHGPQEVIDPRFRALLWIPADSPLREYDLALAESIQDTGARCLIIGTDLRQVSSSDLQVELPPIAPDWQPILDVIPAQIGAYEHALSWGKNPDAFTYCPYVVSTEGGL
jgi:glucosamine--fructose-6-phosphate aminotransferase (isomerizing)